jgi:4-hydroxy-2-oxoheptanedioate aldolase
MARLNKFIHTIEQGDRVAFGGFLPVGDIHGARALGDSSLDFVIVDMEHEGFDFPKMAETLQWLLSPRQLLNTPDGPRSPTPLVRVPPYAAERDLWIIKQALDCGAFGIVAPRVQNAQDARHVVSAARYPQGPNGSGPVGQRGLWQGMALRYWGCESFVDYFPMADLWPYAPDGEMAIVIIVEDREGFDNIEEIVRVDGIAAVIFGIGDGAISLGDPTMDPESPALVAAGERVLRACKEVGVTVGTASYPAGVERAVERGFDFVIGAFTDAPYHPRRQPELSC